jgi:DNA polymerase-3 subunit epsilon
MVFFDVETTGLDYQHGQITQFAGKRVLADGTATAVSWYAKVKEGIDYAVEVQQITNLSTDFLLEHGVFEGELACKIYDFLCFSQPVVLIAHNAQFDMLFLLELLKRYNHPLDIFKYSVLDTITVTRDRKPFPHKLIDMMHHYHHNTDNELHCANTDVDVLIDVFYSMLHERNDIAKYLDVIGVPPKKEIMGYCLPTIRYKTQPWFHWTNPRPPVYA